MARTSSLDTPLNVYICCGKYPVDKALDLALEQIPGVEDFFANMSEEDCQRLAGFESWTCKTFGLIFPKHKHIKPRELKVRTSEYDGNITACVFEFHVDFFVTLATNPPKHITFYDKPTAIKWISEWSRKSGLEYQVLRELLGCAPFELLHEGITLTSENIKEAVDNPHCLILEIVPRYRICSEVYGEQKKNYLC